MRIREILLLRHLSLLVSQRFMQREFVLKLGLPKFYKLGQLAIDVLHVADMRPVYPLVRLHCAARFGHALTQHAQLRFELFEFGIIDRAFFGKMVSFRHNSAPSVDWLMLTRAR